MIPLDVFPESLFNALAGHMSRYWNRSLSGPFGTESDSGGKLSHYPDRIRRS